jgi:hypothetical protein
MNSLVPEQSETPPIRLDSALPPVPFGPAPLVEGEDATCFRSWRHGSR